MPDKSGSTSRQFGELMDEFVDRYRAGEGPSVEDYARRFPDHADEIRDVFPTLLMMEDVGSDGSSDQITPDGSAPRQLGEYRVIREIGRGGMGIVYEAEQETLGRHVALKVLPYYSLMDPKQLKRFRREARAAAQLHHTNIVPVFGVGEHEDVHYYAMQFIRGLGLDEVLNELRCVRSENGRRSSTFAVDRWRRTSEDSNDQVDVNGQADSDTGARSQALAGEIPESVQTSDVEQVNEDHDLSSVTLPGHDDSSTSGASDHRYFRSVARVGIQVADALGYAHGQGVLHRDVKPSNLLLDTHGTVWVTDFGLAKTDGEEITHTGDFVGTLRYMAPERFRGWSDPRSDVYSLGLTLYEMLMLRPAFRSTDRAELVRCITQDEPPRPRWQDRSIPRDLETIILKAISKEPQARYQTASEFAEDLRRFLADRPIVARRTSFSKQTLLWCRRNPVVTSLTALVTVLLIILTIGSWISAFRLSERHKAVVANLTRATRAEASEREARQEATRHLYDAYLARARAGRWSGRAGRRFDSLDALRNAAELVSTLDLGEDARLELRNEAIACMALVDLRVDKRWPDDAPYNSAHRRWGFDGAVERYAKLDAGGELVVCHMSDNAELMRLGGSWYEDASYCPYVRFSPDDRYLAVRGYVEDASLRVRVWDLESEELIVEEVSAGWGYECAIDFMPGSSRIAYLNESRELVLHDVETDTSATLAELGHDAGFLQFAPDGGRIALASVAGIQVFDTTTGDETNRLELPQSVPLAVWSGDGQFLAAACNDGRVYIWDADDLSQRPRVGNGHLSRVRHVAFHANNLLMSTGWDQTTRLWDPFRGDELVRVDLRGSSFSTDGRWLAFEQSGLSVGRCEVTTASECRLLQSESSSDSVIDLHFSQDGQHLASAGRTDGIVVWDVASGDRLAEIDFYQEFRSVILTPDGQHLITSGSGGVDRWPMEAILERDSNALAARRERIGNSDPSFPCEIALSSDGQHLAGSFASDIIDVYPPDDPDNYTRMAGPVTLVWFAAISPDAKWAATSSKQTREIFVWDAKTGERAFTTTSGPHEGALVCFSPDQRWLVVSGASEFVFYDVGSWQELHRLPGERPCIGRIAFSSDMKLMAVGRQREVKLYDTTSFKELATFVGPRQEQVTTTYPEGAGDICFSPDGTLLAIGTMQGTIQLWGLQLIRSQLREMGLDWDGDR